jgi:hypothetical protein
MASIISRVILPGVGGVCPECLSRGHLPALRLSPREVYSFGLTEPPEAATGASARPKATTIPAASDKIRKADRRMQTSRTRLNPTLRAADNLAGRRQRWGRSALFPFRAAAESVNRAGVRIV